MYICQFVYVCVCITYWMGRKEEEKRKKTEGKENAEKKQPCLRWVACMNCRVIKLASKHIFHFVCMDEWETNRVKTQRLVQTITGSGRIPLTRKILNKRKKKNFIQA